ncbi:MAG: TROVE domain-containing protein [Actinomycetota bacterium]|nr:TROVE domain-containing protein [Actinomycetota bacterium]
MGKFNFRRAPRSPIVTETRASGTTFEGGPGFARDPRSELFLLAVSNFGGEDTFYESAEKRDTRYAQLVHEAALADPEWTGRFLAWLRTGANMRTASLVGAAEFVKARLDAGDATECATTNRSVVDSVLQRADEPGELLAYWTTVHGRNIPKPVKRGVADAVRRLYSERSLLKYDSTANGFRFGDVIDVVHPNANEPWQGDLYKYALDRRHNRDNPIPHSLSTLRAREELATMPIEARREALDYQRLRDAGMTWEALAGWLQGPMDAAAWETVIPSMGYMALLRNLRNFDEAGVSDEVAASVAARLTDPEQVARSRQFPFRFLSAYEKVSNPRWNQALDTALRHSLVNLPALPGTSLVLVDTSGSMTSTPFSARSKVTPAKAAAVFGVALGIKGESVDIHGFASGTFRHKIRTGASVIGEIDRFLGRIGEVGHGTDIAESLRSTYRRHDRVFIISDMQTIANGQGVGDTVPAHVPIYGFNLSGHQRAAMATGHGNRHEFGGLTDATFRMVPLLEAGGKADWPF